MGADKLYVTVEPTAGTDAETLLESLETGDFYRWERAEGGLVKLCRHSHDRAITRRMLQPQLERVRRVTMIEIFDTAMMGNGYVYERVDDSLVCIDRTDGGEKYGRDVTTYLEWRHGIDATV